MATAAPYRVQLRFRDGVERSIAVAAHESVLDAALAQSAPVLFQCRSGACASCTAQLTEGTAAMRRAAASVLLRSEAEAGLRLLCQTEAQGDCSFALDYDSTASGGGPVRVKAFVDAVERVAADVARLRLELADGDWFDFRPGQFVRLRVPGTDVARRYSIASAPAELPVVELLVRLLPGGVMSDWLEQRARPDDVVELEAAFGNYFLREHVRAPHLMIAGGTGLAPMMAMLDVIRAKPGRKPPVVLSFGCATEAGLFHRDALDLRALWMPGLEVRISCDGGAANGVRTGNPVEAIVAADTTDPDTIAYVCGPPGLVDAAYQHLTGLGVAAANIHAEQFVATDEGSDAWG